MRTSVDDPCFPPIEYYQWSAIDTKMGCVWLWCGSPSTSQGAWPGRLEGVYLPFPTRSPCAYHVDSFSQWHVAL
jgi:hypothetical protein